MNSFNSIRAIVFKEMVDLMKNKKMLLIIFVFPVFFIILRVVANSEIGTNGASFVLMYSILVPILTIATIVAEEKEKGTLKLLMMSGVRAGEYFIGIAIAIMGFLIMGMIVFEMAGATKNFDSECIVIMTLVVNIISMLIGCIIGRIADNQMSVGPIAVHLTLVIFFLPMIRMIRPEFTFASKYIYSGIFLDVMQKGFYKTSDFVMLMINFAVIFIPFIIFFDRKRIIKSINK